MESSPAPEGETASQRQARLRRERRQAKLSSTGSDRLAMISGVQGRKPPEPEDAPPKSQPSMYNRNSVHSAIF
jgi:GET complex subunit GET2